MNAFLSFATHAHWVVRVRLDQLWTIKVALDRADDLLGSSGNGKRELHSQVQSTQTHRWHSMPFAWA